MKQTGYHDGDGDGGGNDNGDKNEDDDSDDDDDDDDALMVLANGKTGDVADCQSEARVW